MKSDPKSPSHPHAKTSSASQGPNKSEKREADLPMKHRDAAHNTTDNNKTRPGDLPTQQRTKRLPADADGDDAPRDAYDRKQKRANDDSNAGNQVHTSGGRPALSDSSDASSANDDETANEHNADSVDPTKPRRSDAAKLPTANADHSAKHNNQTLRPDSTRNNNGRPDRNQDDTNS